MRHGSTRVPPVGRLWLALALTPLVVTPTTRGDDPAPPPPSAPAPARPATATASAPHLPALPDARLGVRTAPLLLLSREDVCADLALNPTQVADAARAVGDLHARAASLRGKTGPQALAGRKAIDEAERAWLEANLTPDQLVRLLQVSLQWEGPSALVSRPVLADTLGLSADQRTALTQAVARRDAARARPNYSRADERILATQALAILTEAQRQRWRSMLGRHFAPRLAAGGGDKSAPATRR